jgi:hypothetical protein
MARVAPVPVNDTTEPPVTVISDEAKPTGTSEKVIVKGIGESFVGEGALLETVTEGRMRSYIIVSTFDAALLLPAASRAAPDGSDIETDPSDAGVISTEYVAPLPDRLPATPFTTEISSIERFCTGSLKTIDTGIGEVFVLGDADDDRVTIG